MVDDGWFMENPSIDGLGVPLFMETPHSKIEDIMVPKLGQCLTHESQLKVGF